MRCIVLPEPCYDWLETENDSMEVDSGSSDTSSSENCWNLSPVGSPASPFFGPVSPSSPKTAKLEEDFLVLPAEDEKLLQNFEILLSQMQKSEPATCGLVRTPQGSPRLDADNKDDDDVASSLLQTLIQGDNFTDSSNESSNFSIDEVVDFDLTFIDDSTAIAKNPRRKSRAAKKDPSPLDEESRDPCARIRRRGPRRKLQPEDRKLRKKEQNKTAATRYRMKKKAEIEELTTQENELAAKKILLQKEHDDLATELRYLKKLMRETGILE